MRAFDIRDNRVSLVKGGGILDRKLWLLLLVKALADLLRVAKMLVPSR